MKYMGLLLAAATFFGQTSMAAVQENDDYKLVWRDEFDTDGPPNPAYWVFEEGFVRNHELQWYQMPNAWCRNGVLTLTARKEERPNPNYNTKSSKWGDQRPNINYTSASITTKGKVEFLFGRVEVRARIPATQGSWPAIWLKGSKYPWPSCGEIDMMEYYRYKGTPSLLSNVCWGGDNNQSRWNTQAYPFTQFTAKDPTWADKFHIWRMDWDKQYIRLYLDDKLLNETPLAKTINAPTSAGANDNPFETPMFILLNLAMGSSGGTIDEATLPVNYDIDYVRVYQKL